MAGDELIDIKKVINRSSERTTLQDLAKRGIKKVKVLDEKAIRRLIQEAVEQVIVTSGGSAVSEAEKDRLIEQSRLELKNLMREFQESKSHTELLQEDKSDLANQVESLHEQLKLQRKVADDERRAGYREAEDHYRGQLEDERKKGYDDGVASQAKLIEFLEKKNAELDEKAGKAGQAEAAEKRVGELEEQNADLKTRLAELEAAATQVEAQSAAEDAVLGTTLEKLFARMEQNINDRLNKMKGPASGGVVDSRPAAVIVNSAFSEELESNLENLDADKKTAGKISDAVAKLRGMRGGKKEEEKSE
jgi:hypothetical protein